MWPANGLPGNKNNKSVTLYDAGGWYLLAYLGFAMILGTLLDFGWNFLVLHLTLKRLSLAVKRVSKFVYSVIATIIGLFIDWLYYSICWKEGWGEWWPCQPLFTPRDPHPILELATILVPILLIALANYLLARLYLKLETRQAAIVGAAMGVFTAPWIIIIIQLSTSYW
jgi:hypothetical protein